jgi:hypothetical protein
MDGSQMGAHLEVRKSGKVRAFEMILDGKVIDREVYEIGENSILIHELLDEKFALPIPILKFPMKIGDGWDWKGKITSMQETLDAEATIETSASEVAMQGNSVRAICVELQLRIFEKPNKPVTHALRFWFVPGAVNGHGLVKREFGTSTRKIGLG